MAQSAPVADGVNVANANTPGFLAKDIAPFSSVLAQTQLVMSSDIPGHIEPTEADYAPPRLRTTTAPMRPCPAIPSISKTR